MKNNDLYILGQQLRQYRILKGLSQERFAEILEISHTTVGRIENGNHSVNISLFMKIIKALEVDANDILPKRYIPNEKILEREMIDNLVLISNMKPKYQKVILKTINLLIDELIILENKEK